MLADIATVEARRATALRRWWAVAGLVLFAATWKLWTPQSEFPQVPLFGWAGSLPSLVDWLAFGVLLTSLTMSLWKPDDVWNWIAFAVAASVLIVLDQHRLQPWMWQLLLIAVCWTTSGRCAKRAGETLGCLRLLTISIYFWSAISKLDSNFVGSHGQTLIEAMFRSVGINAVNWPASWKSWLALFLPVGELLVAGGLCWPRTRRAGLIAATALHVGLLLALGPLGLGHRPGVLLWNVAFIGHDWLLFGTRALGAIALSLRASLLILVCVWPMTERWGLCDRWLAWSVYAARSERVSVTLTDEGLRRLPESAQRCVTDGELPLDRWSLTALDVPIYPQLRFQFGVVEWLRQRCGEENLIEVNVQQGVSGIERLTVEQLGKRRRAFWVNSQPRLAKSP